MLQPAKRKLTIYKGATFEKVWTWKPGGVPMDFTGCSARMQIRPDYDSSTILLELTTENGGITLGPDGEIRLWVGATQTALIDWDGGVYDLEIQYPAGPDHADRLLQGSVSVSGEVTR